MAAGFFLFKSLNLSGFRKATSAAFAGTANPGNWTVAGACGPGRLFYLNTHYCCSVGADPSTALRDPGRKRLIEQ